MSVHVALSSAVLHSEEEEPKKFRKTRDYFGKRRLHSVAAENGTFGFDEDSNDSGVSTRDTGAGAKCEPNSPSSASVTSGTSSSGASSHSSSESTAVKQRAKVIRMGNKSIQGSILDRGPAASSTPVLAAKPLNRRVSLKTAAKMDDLQVNGQSLDQIKRTKWQNDLQRIMKLLQNSKLTEEAPSSSQGISAVPAQVQMTSSKRRIIPKQKISV